jgi:FHS family glucose/mannose:H+ symporter-like MFS transporter
VGLDGEDGRSPAQRTGFVSALPRRDEALRPADNLVLLSVPAIAGIGATYLLMGMVISSYGPMLGLLTHRFGVTLPAAGSIISVHFAASLIGVVTAMLTLTRLPARTTVIAAVAVIAAGCVVVAFASGWPEFLAGIGVIGVGFGALVVGLNQLVVYSEGPRRTPMLNALNGAYSGGAVAGPVLVATFAQQHLSQLFLFAAGAALLLIPSSVGISGRLPVAVGTPGRPDRLVAVFICAFVLYVAIETGAGGWMASHLAATGLSTQNAARVTSGFFLALATGRLLMLVPNRASERQIVLAGAVCATVALSCAVFVPVAAPVVYVLTGLAIAPIFPTGIAWLSKLRPGDARATAWLYPATAVGGTLGPAAIGVVIGGFGLSWTPAVLAVIAVLMTGTFFSVKRSTA